MSKRIDQFKTAGEPWLPDNEGGIGRPLGLTDLTFGGDPTPGAQLGTIVKTPFGEMPLNASMLQDGFIPAARYQDGTIEIAKLVFPGGATDFLNASGNFVPISVTGMVDPMEDIGDMIIRNAVNVTARLPAGVEGQVLRMTGGLPAWATGTGGADWGEIGGDIEDQGDLQHELTYRDNSINTEAVVIQDVPGSGLRYADCGSPIRLNDGNILVIYERAPIGTDFSGFVFYRRTISGNDEISAAAQLFPDGFITEGAQLNPNPYRMPGGNIGMLFIGFNDETDWHLYFTESADEGVTWSTPAIVLAPEDTDHLVLFYNDRVIRAADGTYYMPIDVNIDDDFSTITGTHQGRLLTSSDGETWTLDAAVFNSPDNGCIEPGIYECDIDPDYPINESGLKLVFYWRSKSGVCYYRQSVDNGATWGAAIVAMSFDTPNAPLVVKHYKRRLFAVYNKVHNGGTGAFPRNELVLAVGSNGEKSFKQIARIAGAENEDIASYGPNIFFDEVRDNPLVFFTPLNNVTTLGELMMTRVSNAVVNTGENDYRPGWATGDFYGGTNLPHGSNNRHILNVWNRTQGFAAGYFSIGSGISDQSAYYPIITTKTDATINGGCEWDVKLGTDSYSSPYSAGLALNVTKNNGSDAVTGADLFAVLNASTAMFRVKFDGTVKIAGGSPGAGKVLTSDADGDATWETPSSGFSDPMTTAGDIIYRNPSNVTARLPIAGTNGHVLTRIDATTIGWAAPSGGSSQWNDNANGIDYMAGNVGIGINLPTSPLHVYGTTSGMVPVVSFSDANGSIGAGMEFHWRAGAANNKRHWMVADSLGWGFYRVDDAGTTILNSGVPDFLIDENGRGSFNNLNPGGALSVRARGSTGSDIALELLDNTGPDYIMVATGDKKVNFYGVIKIQGGSPGAGKVLTSDADGDATWETATGGGVTTMGAFGSTPNATGGTIAGSTLTLQPADATNPGGVSTTTQTFGGAKTFNSQTTFSVTGTASIISVAGTSGIVAAGSSFGGEFTSNAGTPLLVSNNGTGAGVVNAIIIQRNGSYTGAANDGLEVRFAGKSSADTNRNFAMMTAIFSDATNAAETGAITFHMMLAGASMVEKFRMHGNGMFEAAASIKTGAPSGSTAQPWKLGAQTTGSTGITIDATKYVTIDINGVVINLAVAVLP